MKNIIIIVFLSFVAYSSEFHVDKEKDNKVKFVSDAPIEKFEGKSSNIDGYLLGDESDPSNGSELYFEVDLNTLKTGIGLRDRHMRENYLETDKHPLTHFTGKIVEAKKNGNNWDVVVEGDFFVHGKAVKKTIKGTMSKSGSGFKVVSSFTVPISEHDIEVPSLMFKKIDENMELQVEFYLKKVG